MDSHTRPASAWKQHQAAIESHLRFDGIAAIYLCGQPVSGLTSTLIDHIRHRSQISLAPPALLYITASEAERDLTMTSAQSHPSTSSSPTDPGTPCDLLTAQEVSKMTPEALDAGVGRNVIVMIDVKMAATVHEELAFGAVLAWIDAMAKDELPARVPIFLLGPWFSTRTLDAFAALIPTMVLEIVNTNEEIPFEQYDSEKLLELRPLTQQAIQDGQQVLVLGEWTQDVEDLMRHSGNLNSPIISPQFLSHLAVTDQRLTGQFLLADPSLAITTTSPIGLVVSPSRATEDWVFDSKTNQVVKAARNLTRHELDIAQSWIRKSSVPGPRPRLFTNYDRAHYDGVEIGDERLGPAWNRDLMHLVLALLARADGAPLESLPGRAWVHPAMIHSRAMRLCQLGCARVEVRGHTTPILLVTPRGHEMLALLDSVPASVPATATASSISWESAWLLMTARRPDQSLDDATRRVLVHMAALLTDPRTIPRYIERTGNVWAAFDHGINECPDVVAALQHRGSIWLATGVLLAECASDDDPDPGQDFEGLITWGTLGRALKARVADLYGLCGLDPDGDTTEPPEWVDVPLTRDQVDAVDRALVMALLHRVVRLDADLEIRDAEAPRLAVGADLVSGEMVMVDQEHEFLDIGAWRRRAWRHGGERSFYAVYGDICRDGEVYTCRGLTWIPPVLEPSYQDEGGNPWAQVLL